MARKGKKFTTRGTKRKANQVKHPVSKKVKQSTSTPRQIEKPEQSFNSNKDSSDESDENENANSISTLRENLGVKNQGDTSDDETDGTKPNPDKHILPYSDLCIKNISTSGECEEYELICLSQPDSMSQDQRNSTTSTFESNSIQNEASNCYEADDTGNIEDYSDPFVKHILSEIPPSLLSSVQTYPKVVDRFIEKWKMLGELTVKIPIMSNVTMPEMPTTLEEKINYTQGGYIPKIYDLKQTSLGDMHIKPQISVNLVSQKNNSLKEGNESTENPFMTSFQNELFSIVNNYKDLYYTKRTFKNSEDIRFVYCLHLINHVLKTRSKILHHNAKVCSMDDMALEYRDQGLVRPKVLVLVPFMESAFKIVSLLERILLPVNKGKVMNKKRFLEEYTGNEVIMPYRNRKPEDFESTFIGNINDDFKVGISVTKKSLKLYAEFYSADIIIASPLGLRRIIGAEGEQDRDYDFLASIEILILDQTDIFLMQNWNHLIHILDHLHLQPKTSHGVDFSRVRSWSLTGKSKFYRQTLIFSSFDTPEIASVFNKRCSNYAGSFKSVTFVRDGSIARVVVQLPHRFYKFSAASTKDSVSKRFHFFIKNILPSYKDMLVKQVVIFIPNYYDFVQMRNYFKKEVISFTQICEYSKERKVARARDMFFHADVQFLLYTERFHFFNRIKLKGIRHLVFYQLPYSARFYSEMCNLMQENYLKKGRECDSPASVSVIFSKYDIYQLGAVVGIVKANKLINSERDIHMIVTGES